MSKLGIYHLYLDVWLMGKAYGGLPFPGTGCPAREVGNIYLVWNDWNMG